ncbi:MAG TPA: heparinase II/III family protein, partial [Hyphomicrobiaceae bacterium]
ASAQEASQAMARATVSHNTLCLNKTSSSRLVPLDGAQSLHGLQLPDEVESNLAEHGGSLSLEAWHDGYLDQFGLLHARRLVLSEDGERVDGIDRLEPPTGVLRTRQDLPFSIHFHLPSEAICRLGEAPETAEIQVEPNSYWRLTAAGARLSVEASTDLVHLSGPRRAMQVVLRGACPGETTVTWSLERVRHDDA